MEKEIMYRNCPWCGNETPLDTKSVLVDGMVFTCETCGEDLVVVKCPQTEVIFVDKFDEDDLIGEVYYE